ncbi:hypothetical protein F3Y22_tig00110387pilonHSYRG00110 [Hibiscus syriacus]|uniref:RRM domain-containing protein n=1 Tax=Hibiscus syriacus TaxID=106335 RepID=A0A6A3ASK6_HIBSY|nr:hypothetical protein F3Y22_tig00110387pilonHSYRG00110 [Hibiscus syriacus]
MSVATSTQHVQDFLGEFHYFRRFLLYTPYVQTQPSPENPHNSSDTTADNNSFNGIRNIVITVRIEVSEFIGLGTPVSKHRGQAKSIEDLSKSELLDRVKTAGHCLIETCEQIVGCSQASAGSSEPAPPPETILNLPILAPEDSFIPNKRSKGGSRFGFVHFASLEDATKAIFCADRSRIHGNIVRVFMARFKPREAFWRKKSSTPKPVVAKSRAENALEAPIVGVIDEDKLSTLKFSLWKYGRKGTPPFVWNPSTFRNIAGNWGELISIEEGTLNPGSFDRALIQFEPCFNLESVWEDSLLIDVAVAYSVPEKALVVPRLEEVWAKDSDLQAGRHGPNAHIALCQRSSFSNEEVGNLLVHVDPLVELCSGAVGNNLELALSHSVMRLNKYSRGHVEDTYYHDHDHDHDPRRDGDGGGARESPLFSITQQGSGKAKPLIPFPIVFPILCGIEHYQLGVFIRVGFPTSLLSDREQGGLSRAAAAVRLVSGRGNGCGNDLPAGHVEHDLDGHSSPLDRMMTNGYVVSPNVELDSFRKKVEGSLSQHPVGRDSEESLSLPLRSFTKNLKLKKFGSMLDIQGKVLSKAERRRRDLALKKFNLSQSDLLLSELSDTSISDSVLKQRWAEAYVEAHEAVFLGRQLGLVGGSPENVIL